VARSNPCVLRVEPPLIVSEEEAAHFLRAVDACCEELDWLLNSFDRMIAKSVLGQHDARWMPREAIRT
jgi:hypothetical protein